MTFRRLAILGLLAALAIVPVLSLGVGSFLTQPSSGATLRAWLLVPDAPKAAVVLLHGVHANRRPMLPRAELLWRAGYVVLLPDLQAHGESTGDRITFGYLEARDAQACLRYLRSRFPGLRVGGVGVSLGGAALVLAGEAAGSDADVLEAVFPTIAEATDNRVAIRVGALSHVVTPLLLWQLKPRFGIGVDDRAGYAAHVLGFLDRHLAEGRP